VPLTDTLAAARTILAGHCPFAEVRAALTANDQATLDAAMADTTNPSQAIASALTDVGQRIAPDDVRNHRAGDCPCAIPTGAPA
jgi:hypothetical protein